MYTCPNMDIHSIYVDNELPAPYKKEFEDHLSKCEFCRKRFEKIQTISMNLKEDSNNLVISQETLNESFKKLNTIMRFKQNAKPAQNDFSIIKKVLPFVTAAAFLLAILPVAFYRKSIQTLDNNLLTLNTSLSTIAPKANSLINQNNIISQRQVSLSNTNSNHRVNLPQELIIDTPEIDVIDIFKPDLPEQITIQIDFSIIPNIQNTEHQMYHLQNVSLINSGMAF